MTKRLFDIFFVCFISIFVLPLALSTAILVKVTSQGPALYWSKRVGINNRLFNMPKFRSMKTNTPALATHLMNEHGKSNEYLTSIGNFIRKTSLDELPQLWSVLKGDMSIVGPRPALFNQYDLIQTRSDAGVHKLKPGITGWAQVNGRDEISIVKKVNLDAEYLKSQSFNLDCYIILMTFLKVIKRDDVSH